MGLNFCCTTNSHTCKSATNSGTFDSATIFFLKNKYGSKCLKLPKSSRNAKKNLEKLVTLSKVQLLVALLHVRLIVVQQKFRPLGYDQNFCFFLIKNYGL